MFSVEYMSKRFEQAKAYTEKYRGKLSPCRYCGNTDIRIASDRESVVVGTDRKAGTAKVKYQNVWSVVCSTPYCDCSKSFTSVRKAIEHWNEKQNKGVIK